MPLNNTILGVAQRQPLARFGPRGMRTFSSLIQKEPGKIAPTITNVWKVAGSNTTQNLTVAVTRGRALIVAVLNYQGQVTDQAISDNIEGTAGWVRGPTQNVFPIALWYKLNCPAGITTLAITGTPSGSGGTYGTVVAHEVMDVGSVDLAESTGGNANNANPRSGAVTVNQANSMLFAAMCGGSGGNPCQLDINGANTTGSWGLFNLDNSQELNGATLIEISVPNRIVPAIGSVEHGWTTQSAIWNAVIMTVKFGVASLSTIVESATAVDSTDATISSGTSSVAESASAVDAPSAMALFPVSVAEALSGSSTPSFVNKWSFAWYPTGSGTTPTITGVNPSGTNRILIVQTTAAFGSAGTGVVLGVTHNGKSFTKLTSHQFYDTSGSAEIWYLINPDAVSASVIVTLTGNTVEGAIFASCYSGVDQVTPFGTPVNTDLGSGTGSPVTVAPTTTLLDLGLFIRYTTYGSSLPAQDAVSGLTARGADGNSSGAATYLWDGAGVAGSMSKALTIGGGAGLYGGAFGVALKGISSSVADTCNAVVVSVAAESASASDTSSATVTQAAMVAERILAQLVTDDFNRANGGLGANWTTIYGTGPTIVSNKVGRNSADGAAINNTISPPSDQYAQAVFLTTGSQDSKGVIVRGSATSNFYLLYLFANQLYLYKCVAGSFTQLIISSSLTLGTDPVCRLEVVGTTLTGYLNGAPVVTITDASLSTGKPGIYYDDANGAYLDDFSGGQFVPQDSSDGTNASGAVTISESASAADTSSATSIQPATVAEVGSAVDVPSAGTQTPASIAETASAADAPSSTSIQPATVAESGSASETSNGSIVCIAAESASAADTCSATVLAAASVGETVTATDAPSAATLASVACAESATATSNQSTAAFYAGIVAESASASDTTANTATFAATQTESVTATDNPSCTAVFVVAVVESSAASNSQDGSTGALISESASATDNPSANAIFNAAVAETGTAVDAPSTINLTPSAIAESVTASDSCSCTVIFGAAQIEAGNAVDAPSSTAIFVVAVSEAATATSSQDGSTGALISESASAVDTCNATGVFNAAVVESVSATDTCSASIVTQAASVETATAVDTISCLANFLASVLESVTASDTINSNAIFVLSVNESVTPNSNQDASTGGGGLISESTSAVDSQSTTAIFQTNVIEAASALETAQANYLVAHAETANAVDACSAGIQTPALVNETTTALDTTNQTAIFGASIAEAGVASDRTDYIGSGMVSITQSANAQDTCSAANSKRHVVFIADADYKHGFIADHDYKTVFRATKL